MKKYIITGSLGNISKPIIEGLVKNGKDVKVVTSKVDKVKEIEKIGAKALVGDLNDALFLKEAFKEAEIVYTMIPPLWQTSDLRKSQNLIADNYISAIEYSHIAYVVNLSSVGAHLEKGCGPVDGIYDFEQKLNKLDNIKVKHLRPAYFYYNLLAQIPMAKAAGILGSNFGNDHTLFLVHPSDIAKIALEELLKLDFTGSSVRYIAGDERSGKEIAQVLGNAVGKDLNWVEFTDEQQKEGLLGAGLPVTIAEAFTDMGQALRNGTMQEDIRKNRPAFGSLKLEDFAKEFAQAFNA